MRRSRAVAVAVLIVVGAGAQQATRAAPAGVLSPADMREDLAVFRREFLERDRAYPKAARAEAEARLAALERAVGAAGSVDPVLFRVELCRITALADSGHSKCLTWPLADVLNRIPVEIVLFGDFFTVIGGAPAHEDLLGARLAAVDGRPIDAVRRAAHALVGGIEKHRDVEIIPLLRSPEALHAIGIALGARGASYRFVTRDGRALERSIAADASDWSTWRWLSPGARAPWAFRELHERFRRRDAPELDAMVIQIRHVDDAGGRSIHDFLNDTEAERKRLGRRNVVVDLRFNREGGNFMTVWTFMIGLPAEVGAKGRIYVLLGPGTFSAGIASAAYLKQAGGNRVVLVGEPPGDNLMFFAEGHIATLPRSRLMVLPATTRHDYRNGCRAFDDCFVALAQPGRPTGSPPELAATVPRRPIAIPTLDPDIGAPFTVEAFAAGRDPAIDAVAAAISKPR